MPRSWWPTAPRIWAYSGNGTPSAELSGNRRQALQSKYQAAQRRFNFPDGETHTWAYWRAPLQAMLPDLSRAPTTATGCDWPPPMLDVRSLPARPHILRPQPWPRQPPPQRVPSPRSANSDTVRPRPPSRPPPDPATPNPAQPLGLRSATKTRPLPSPARRPAHPRPPPPPASGPAPHRRRSAPN